MDGEKIIGVIGGMGPYAGLDLVKKIFDETVAGTDQEHVPVALLSYSSRISDRTDYMLEGRGTNPVAAITEIAEKLDEIGAVVAGMPCNSAHAPPIFDGVMHSLKERRIPLRMVNMIGEVARELACRDTNSRKVGVLSTNSIFHLAVYKNALTAAGVEVILPPVDLQEALVHPAIYDPVYGIKAQSNPVTQQAIDNLATVCSLFTEKGAGAIVLGCTELPLAIAGDSFMGLTTIDPTRILARALIRETYPEKLKSAV